jgi:orotate phosphoribosyltransferase
MDYKKLLENSNALLKGHFLLTSGLHSDKYIEKMRILENPALMKPFFEKMKALSPVADWFVGPTLGGAIIAFELARITGKRSAFAERTEKGRALKREFAIKKSDKIVVADDILTTGSSIKETIKALDKGKIVAVVVMIDRSVEEIEFGIPVKSALKYPIEIFRPEICPLCKEKIPITRRGGKR